MRTCLRHVWLVAALLVGACVRSGGEAPVESLRLDAPEVRYRVGDGDVRNWRLAENFNGVGEGPFSIGYVPYEDGRAVFGVEVDRARSVPVCFEPPEGQRCFNVSDRRRYDLTFIAADASYPIRLRAETPAASFSKGYQAANRGKITTVAPPFYELFNVAIALTPTAEENPGAVYTDTDYYLRLRRHFEPFLEHPLVARIDAALVEKLLNYYILKTNALTFQFDETGAIVPSEVYFRGGFPGSQVNDLASYIADFQSFADDTDFLAFYRANQSVFDGQVAFFENDLDANDMLGWLQRHFPDADAFDGVKIVISPLVGYVQYLLRYEEDGYRELQPHVNFPYRSNPNLGERAAAIARGSLLFTEMNHGFIAPPKDLLDDIEAAFADVAFWVDPESDSAGTYGTPLDAFDEQMNWALLSLYAFDRMPKEDWQTYKASVTRNMELQRGFPHFAAFNNQLSALYLGRPDGATVADLYPDMIAWAAAYYADLAV